MIVKRSLLVRVFKQGGGNLRKYVLKRLIVTLLAMIMLGEALTPAASKKVEAASQRWGVFIGGHVRSLKKVKPYNYIVIDAQHYSKKEIKRLKKGGRKVYSYLSIGTIAKYRPYYKKFKKYALGKYNNWNSERWVDVRKKAWQKFFLNELVPKLKKKGINGLWIDNTDVYYEYPKKKIFKSLVYMLKKIHKKKIPVIINGGDVFVDQLIRTKKQYLIKGIMQEEVLTFIQDYNKGIFTRQGLEDYIYFTSYIERCKANGIKVSLLEYSTDPAMTKEIKDYCKKNGYSYYICNNVMLK